MIGNSITPINSVGNLWAQELQAEELEEDFRKRYGEVMKKIADRGTYFDQQDISDFVSLSLPGLDEVMAVIKIADILRGGHYDVIILDTAPTGHTLRLLTLPDLLAQWVRVFDLMQEKHRYLSMQFSGRYRKDDADAFLERMDKDVKGVRSLLRNSETTEFIPVTLPEPMSIEETERLLAALRKQKISVKRIIVNRVEKGESNCALCLSRRKGQEMYLAEIEKRFAGYTLYKVPLFPHEIRGIEHLRGFAEILFGERNVPVTPPSPGLRPPSPSRGEGRGEGEKRCFDIGSDHPTLRFILFGGKGGVGKTSLASATALWMARNHPTQKILIFSTDPAHSLSDSFDHPIGDKITPIEGLDNLYGIEINAPQLFADFQKGYSEGIDELFDRFLGSQMDIKFDREVMSELVSLSPPGLDEIMALVKMIEFVEAEEYDLYILDTAATGHLLRFLELPGLVRDWLKAVFRLLIKYKGVMRLTEAAGRMVELSRNIRKIREILTDPDRCEFVAITIPEAMGLAELKRLLASLERLKIPCHHIVINMVIPLTHCRFCLSKRREQEKYREEIHRMDRRYHIGEIPLFPHEIRGREGLRELAEVL